ncbi:MAG: hypothetical protein KDA51_16615, partial [Planctomycetales bacterium]|nr:hypothetical protein [Planctomycetales bacterium]
MPSGESDFSAADPEKGLPLIPMLLLAGVAALGAFATLFSVWVRSEAPSNHDQLRIAMDEYTASRYELCQQIAAAVEVDPEAAVEDFRIREFLLGASGVRFAYAIEEPLEMRLAVNASLPHLEWLQRTEFPP